MRARSKAVAWCLASAAAAIAPACSRGEPPSWDAAGGSLAVAAMTTSPNATAVDAGRTDAAADAGIDPATLPQTHDRPEPSGAAFDARVQSLWEAIVQDDPDHALPFFFPLPAYEQVKAIGNPAADWRRRLVAAYTHDIHALHARLGTAASRARFVRIDVPMERARWVDPGEEYNKLGYFRVFGSKIVYEVDPPEGSNAAAKSATFDITSLISWRGAWYCVHLSGVR